ncbi:MAG: 6-phosphogluconolactonase, partial [Candidatus Saccharimonadales bacterium]
STLWLVPGGSNIALAVAVMERLSDELTQDLTIALSDERFGPYNHPDSNWTQLKRFGFEPKKARVIETLIQGDNSDMATVVQRYNAEIDDALDNVTTAIGLFGMGIDGHIAGILPGSPATNEQDYATVTGYSATPFNRITITFPAIRRLKTAFLIAMGEDKRSQLERLIAQDVPLNIQPAQIIKQVSEAYVYNDQVGGKE